MIEVNNVAIALNHPFSKPSAGRAITPYQPPADGALLHVTVPGFSLI
jgi:hypothetical protein